MLCLPLCIALGMTSCYLGICTRATSRQSSHLSAHIAYSICFCAGFGLTDILGRALNSPSKKIPDGAVIALVLFYAYRTD